jgi:hypothetical protein
MNPEHDRPRTGPERVVTTRAPITAGTVAERAHVADDPSLAGIAQDVFALQADRSRLHARFLRQLAPLWAGRDSDDADEASGEVEDLVAAMGLRATRNRAYGLVRDAHRAVTFFPRLLDLLTRGVITVEAFGQVLRRSTRLTDEEQSRVDEHVATWDPGLPAETFNRALGQLCAYVHEIEDRVLEAERMRQITVRAPREDDGIATIEINGPAPEILTFGKRLDETARMINRAQRHALEQRAAGDTGVVIPFDDGTVATTGTPMGRGAIRYLLATRAEWDVDAIQVPEPRFRLNVTVPAMTLMGASDAPGMLDGIHPLPADMARHLAGDNDVWYRILTDPATGTFLPLPADRYTPSKAMAEHLRLRNPVCAVPGCENTTSVASEVDHIIEYDHQDPEHGGHTEIGNLHILCWRHHQLKTMGLLDPTRLTDPADPPGGTTDGSSGPTDGTTVPSGASVPGTDAGGIAPGRTRWTFGTGPGGEAATVQADETDLIGAMEAAALQFMWERYLHHDPPPPTVPGTGQPGASLKDKDIDDAFRTAHEAYGTPHHAQRDPGPGPDQDLVNGPPPKTTGPEPFDPDDPPPF